MSRVDDGANEIRHVDPARAVVGREATGMHIAPDAAQVAPDAAQVAPAAQRPLHRCPQNVRSTG